jgi:hypothetical protein
MTYLLHFSFLIQNINDSGLCIVIKWVLLSNCINFFLDSTTMASATIYRALLTIYIFRQDPSLITNSNIKPPTEQFHVNYPQKTELSTPPPKPPFFLHFIFFMDFQHSPKEPSLTNVVPPWLLPRASTHSELASL